MSDPHGNQDIVNLTQDIYVMLSDGQIAYLPYTFYSNPSRIIEQVEQNGTFFQRFFLNEAGQYPMNFVGSTVSKVINWNLLDQNGEPKSFNNNPSITPETGYFIDLRTLEMNRLNMYQLENPPILGADTPINESSLPKTNGTFVPVPKDKQSELKATPKNDNLYIAFFTEPTKTHANDQCYSYCLSYITAEELRKQIVTLQSDHKNCVELLKTYYGDAQVQAGAINPADIDQTSLGMTCYVANLSTFNKS